VTIILATTGLEPETTERTNFLISISYQFFNVNVIGDGISSSETFSSGFSIPATLERILLDVS